MISKIILSTFLILAFSSALVNAAAPAIHIWYNPGDGKYSDFAIQLSGDFIAQNTYWCALGFDGGYSGMQTYNATGLAEDSGQNTQYVFSQNNTKNGNAQNIWHADEVNIMPFGGEGQGVQASSHGLIGTWKEASLYTFHIKARAYGSGTALTLNVWKPETNQWYKFATHYRPDDNTTTQGMIDGPYSFLEDYTGNNQQRNGSIHGAWFKTSQTDQWQNVTSIASDYNNPSEANGNEMCFPTADDHSGADRLWYQTGGDHSTGFPSKMWNGTVNFPAPFWNGTPPPEDTVYDIQKKIQKLLESFS